MAEKDPAPKSTWPVPMLLLVTLAGGYLFTQSPLKSFRPFHESLDTSSINIDQQVPARLWQDPLEAVIKYKTKPKDQTLFVETGEMIKQIQEVITKKDSDNDKGKATPAKLTVLISTLDDSPYSEGRETRIRVRYAVGAALDHVCYVPDSSESLGLMKWNANKLDGNGKALKEIIKGQSVDKTVDLEVPFEWYRKRKLVTCTNAEQYPGKLLVLWVKSSDIDKAPLHYLHQLVTALVINPPKNSVSIKLLGPWGSDALRVMIGAAQTNGTALTWSDSAVELLSPWATADPLLLLGSEMPLVLENRLDELGLKSARGAIASSFKKVGIDWSYSVGSDRDIMSQLGEELDRRQVDIGNAKIAVVSEWDTFYGRMLPLEFRATALCKRCNNTFCSSDEEWRIALKYSQNPDEVKTDVHHFTYMRGLDGEIAHEERPTTSKSPKSDQESIYELWKNDQSISSLERPDGPSQYDYVRRLSAQLKHSQTVDDPYVAIGVLGSDPYDKLLILQALREEFPAAIFFTTDLDARFLHPSQQSWARNLIIASPFGLRLDDQHQRDIPPFRDSYQSAAYHALITSLTITRGDPTKGASQQILPRGCLEPQCVRLFEVGRTQFVNLSQDFPEPHPREEEDLGRGPSHPATILEKTFLGIVLACVLLISLRQASTRSVLVSVVISGIVLASLALCWHWASDPQQEPFFWAEGVSIWPTELVRLAAFAITIVFIVKILLSLKRGKAEIVKRYVTDSNHREDEFDFPKLWMKHDADTNWCTLSYRVGIGIILAIALFGLLFTSFARPVVPARGSMALGVDIVVLCVSVLTLYVLLLLVAYLCIAGSALLDNLRAHRVGPLTGWGEDPSMRLPRAILNDWFAIRVSADYTAIFASVAPYPLYVLFLLIVSRNGYFDHWTFPVSLILAYFIMFGLLAFSSMTLWSRGSKLRGEVLGSLQAHLATAHRQRDTILAENIEKIIEEVANLKKGVYGTWRDQPVWSTILYPLGGVTILSFLDFMAGR